ARGAPSLTLRARVRRSTRPYTAPVAVRPRPGGRQLLVTFCPPPGREGLFCGPHARRSQLFRDVPRQSGGDCTCQRDRPCGTIFLSARGPTPGTAGGRAESEHERIGTDWNLSRGKRTHVEFTPSQRCRGGPRLDGRPHLHPYRGRPG